MTTDALVYVTCDRCGLAHRREVVWQCQIRGYDWAGKPFWSDPESLCPNCRRQLRGKWRRCP